MPFILNPRLVLVKHPSSIVLHEVPLISETKFLEHVSAGTAILLALFNGILSVDEVLAETDALGYPELIRSALRQRIDGFVKRGILVEAGANRESTRRYDPLSFAYQADLRPRGTRFEAPVGMTYVCTRKCGLRCRYCYADADSEIEELLLPLSRVLEIIDEAADLGISTINISGGEPFSRPGIFEILDRTVQRGIYPAITTKAHLSESSAARLGRIGIRSIQVSLDSNEAAINDNLVGRTGHHEGVVRTIRHLVKHGIEVRINTVVTAVNIRTLPGLAQFLEDCGVNEVCFAPYAETLGRHAASLELSVSDSAWLSQILPEIVTRHPKLKVSSPYLLSKRFVESETTDRDLPHGRLYCGVGIHGFILLPDGRVTVCERLTDGRGLIVGNLRTQTIMEMWNSPLWHDVCQPPQELYRGTSCFSCSSFDRCTTQRRRCFITSLTAFGRMYGPMPTCPHLRPGVVGFKDGNRSELAQRRL